MEGTASIVLSGGSGNQSYLWTDANGTQSVGSPTTLGAGINTVQVTDALTFCQVTHTFLITQPPALTLNIARSSPSVCMGGSISFTSLASGGVGGYTYSWTAGPLNSNVKTVSEPIAATYTYTGLARDGNNCPVSHTVDAKFVANPTVSVSSPTICPLELTSLIATGATSYTWGSGGFSGNPFV